MSKVVYGFSLMCLEFRVVAREITWFITLVGYTSRPCEYEKVARLHMRIISSKIDFGPCSRKSSISFFDRNTAKRCSCDLSLLLWFEKFERKRVFYHVIIQSRSRSTHGNHKNWLEWHLSPGGFIPSFDERWSRKILGPRASTHSL